MRQGWVRTGLIGGMCIALGLAAGRTAGAQPAPGVERLSVRAFGAVGDGKADDTAAFERALAQGRERRLPVVVPRGTYRLTRTLRLKEQTLTGGDAAGWPADTMPLPILQIDHVSGPGVAMEAAATLDGLALLYALDTKFPAANPPPAVSLEGQGPTISRLRIQYPYDGIMTAPKAFPGRARLSDIFIVSPKHDGVYLTRSLDVSQMRNIEVWCNVGMSAGAGFRFGRNDDCQCSDLFAFQCQVAYQFDKDDSPGEGGGHFLGSLTNCSSDACSLGYVIRGDHRINLANSNLVNHHDSLSIDGKAASVRVIGCQMQSNGAPALRVVNAGNVIITGCLFTRAFKADFYYLEAQRCGSLTMTGCQFKPFSRGALLGEGVQRAVVTHNSFEGEMKAITDRMPAGAKKLLAPNLMDGPK